MGEGKTQTGCRMGGVCNTRGSALASEGRQPRASPRGCRRFQITAGSNASLTHRRALSSSTRAFKQRLDPPAWADRPCPRGQQAASTGTRRRALLPGLHCTPLNGPLSVPTSPVSTAEQSQDVPLLISEVPSDHGGTQLNGSNKHCR